MQSATWRLTVHNTFGFRRPTETVFVTTPAGAEYIRVPVAGVFEMRHASRRGERPPRLNARIYTYRARRKDVDIPVPMGCLSLLLMPCADPTLPDAYRKAADLVAQSTGKDRLLVRVADGVRMIRPTQMSSQEMRGAQILYRASAPQPRVA